MLAYAQDEPAAPRVERALAEGCVMSWINAGEVLYIASRRHGRPLADAAIDLLRRRVELEEPDAHLVLDAAGLKARARLSYADAFAVVTARLHDATLLTGDPEILALSGEVDMIDLRAVSR